MNRDKFSFLRKIKKETWEKISIIFLLGVFLLLAATPASNVTKKKETDKNLSLEPQVQKEETEINSIKNDAYITMLENKLEQMITGMEGAGETFVMITCEDTGEKVLDKNQPYESETNQVKEGEKETNQSRIRKDDETVFMEQQGDTTPIVTLQRYPVIEGVVVVCEGGDNSVTVLRIKEAVQALFDIDVHKIVVCKMKKGKKV